MDDNPFVISDAVNAEFVVGLDGGDGALDTTAQRDGVDAAVEHFVGEAEDTSAEGLIPLCVRHAQGPRIDTALFGYDIALLEQRPWTRPDANLSDYFNYGFNEHSWRAYCAMQSQGNAAVAAGAEAMLQRLRQDIEASVAASGAHGGRGGMGAAGGGIGPSGMAGEGRFERRDFRDGAGGGAMRGTGLGNLYYKTKLCRSFMEGRCTNADCKYAHGEAELRAPPPQQFGGMGGPGGVGGGAPPVGAMPFGQPFGAPPMPPPSNPMHDGASQMMHGAYGGAPGGGMMPANGDPFAPPTPSGFRMYPSMQ